MRAIPLSALLLVLAALFPTPASGQCGGTPGSRGIPRLALDRPMLGSTMDIDIYGGRPGAFYLLVMTAGGGQVKTPIGTICLNLALPLYANAGYLDGRGEATLSLPIFNLPGLLHLPVHAQAAILDSANPTGYALTNSVATQVVPPYGVIAGRGTTGNILRIDMRNGNVIDTVKAGAGTIHCSAFSKSGRYLFAGSNDGRVYCVDYGVRPPAVRSLLLGSRNWIYGMAVTRDGRFAYATAYGYPRGSISPTWVIDADPLSPTFFTRIATVKGYPATHTEGQGTKACPDRRWVCNVVLGLGTGRTQISKVDADPASPGFNTVVGTLALSGGWAVNLAIRPGNQYAYVSMMNLGGTAKVPVVDTNTMKCVDQDPGAWGCQYLGGEVMKPRTPLGNSLLGIDDDEAGRELFLVDIISRTTPPVYNVRRVNINPASSSYHQVTKVYPLPIVLQPYQCAVTPDGSRLVVTYNSATRATLLDAVTGQVIKNFTLGFRADWAAVK